MKTLHAFYSRIQETLLAVEYIDDVFTGKRYEGTVSVYRFPDGQEKVCTELKETREHNFSDSVYLGEVEIPGNFVRSIKAQKHLP